MLSTVIVLRDGRNIDAFFREEMISSDMQRSLLDVLVMLLVAALLSTAQTSVGQHWIVMAGVFHLSSFGAIVIKVTIFTGSNVGMALLQAGSVMCLVQLAVSAAAGGFSFLGHRSRACRITLVFLALLPATFGMWLLGAFDDRLCLPMPTPPLPSSSSAANGTITAAATPVEWKYVLPRYNDSEPSSMGSWYSGMAVMPVQVDMSKTPTRDVRLFVSSGSDMIDIQCYSMF